MIFINGIFKLLCIYFHMLKILLFCRSKGCGKFNIFRNRRCNYESMADPGGNPIKTGKKKEVRPSSYSAFGSIIRGISNIHNQCLIVFV